MDKCLSNLMSLLNKKFLNYGFLRIFGFKTKLLSIALHYYTPKKNTNNSNNSNNI